MSSATAARPLLFFLFGAGPNWTSGRRHAAGHVAQQYTVSRTAWYRARWQRARNNDWQLECPVIDMRPAEVILQLGTRADGHADKDDR